MSSMTTLVEDVRRLATSAGREVGTPGHREARRTLVERMRELELEPYAGDGFELPYLGRFTNLLGVRRGGAPALDPLLLAAHYDTCGPLPGADDNAAAVAIALATAESLARHPPERSVVFAFFDAEEPPYFLGPEMGSQHFYAHQRRGGIHLALVMDLVGHAVPLPGLEDLLVVTGIESDPALPGIVRAQAERPGLRVVATLNRYVGDISDHGAFRRARRPYLFLSCGHWPHYHEPTDTPEKLDYAKMLRIQSFVEGCLRAAARHELAGPSERSDTTALEIELMERALGPYLRRARIALHGRADVDALVRSLVQRGL
jgi:hypothetical protein